MGVVLAAGAFDTTVVIIITILFIVKSARNLVTPSSPPFRRAKRAGEKPWEFCYQIQGDRKKSARGAHREFLGGVPPDVLKSSHLPPPCFNPWAEEGGVCD